MNPDVDDEEDNNGEDRCSQDGVEHLVDEREPELLPIILGPVLYQGHPHDGGDVEEDRADH